MTTFKKIRLTLFILKIYLLAVCCAGWLLLRVVSGGYSLGGGSERHVAVASLVAEPGL